MLIAIFHKKNTFSNCVIDCLHTYLVTKLYPLKLATKNDCTAQTVVIQLTESLKGGFEILGNMLTHCLVKIWMRKLISHSVFMERWLEAS